MRRSYRQDRYLGILSRVRAALPEAAITTDIIVGFPGETEADFAETLHVVREARFAGAFTFQYSPRPGTPAAGMPDQVPRVVVQERYERLVALQDDIALAENRQRVGRTVQVLVAEGEGRKDGSTGRLSGRARDGRLVHLQAGPRRPAKGAGVPGTDELVGWAAGASAAGSAALRPGDLVTMTVTHAAPHHLIADGPILVHRRTRAGDAWEAGRRPGGPAVLLGLPSVRSGGSAG